MHFDLQFIILSLRFLQESMTDWDDKMQMECAKSFIRPLELHVRIGY